MECSQLLAEDKMVGQKVSFKSSSRHEISKSNVARECRRVSQVIRLARRATAPWTKCAMRTRSNKRAFSKIQPNAGRGSGCARSSCRGPNLETSGVHCAAACATLPYVDFTMVTYFLNNHSGDYGLIQFLLSSIFIKLSMLES